MPLNLSRVSHRLFVGSSFIGAAAAIPFLNPALAPFLIPALAKAGGDVVLGEVYDHVKKRIDPKGLEENHDIQKVTAMAVKLVLFKYASRVPQYSRPIKSIAKHLSKNWGEYHEDKAWENELEPTSFSSLPEFLSPSAQPLEQSVWKELIVSAMKEKGIGLPIPVIDEASHALCTQYSVFVWEILKRDFGGQGPAKGLAFPALQMQFFSQTVEALALVQLQLEDADQVRREAFGKLADGLNAYFKVAKQRTDKLESNTQIINENLRKGFRAAGDKLIEICNGLEELKSQVTQFQQDVADEHQIEKFSSPKNWDEVESHVGIILSPDARPQLPWEQQETNDLTKSIELLGAFAFANYFKHRFGSEPSDFIKSEIELAVNRDAELLKFYEQKRVIQLQGEFFDSAFRDFLAAKFAVKNIESEEGQNWIEWIINQKPEGIRLLELANREFQIEQRLRVFADSQVFETQKTMDKKLYSLFLLLRLDALLGLEPIDSYSINWLKKIGFDVAIPEAVRALGANSEEMRRIIGIVEQPELARLIGPYLDDPDYSLDLYLSGNIKQAVQIIYGDQDANADATENTESLVVWIYRENESLIPPAHLVDLFIRVYQRKNSRADRQLSRQALEVLLRFDSLIEILEKLDHKTQSQLLLDLKDYRKIKSATDLVAILKNRIVAGSLDIEIQAAAKELIDAG